VDFIWALLLHRDELHSVFPLYLDPYSFLFQITKTDPPSDSGTHHSPHTYSSPSPAPPLPTAHASSVPGPDSPAYSDCLIPPRRHRVLGSLLYRFPHRFVLWSSKMRHWRTASVMFAIARRYSAGCWDVLARAGTGGCAFGGRLRLLRRGPHWCCVWRRSRRLRPRRWGWPSRSYRIVSGGVLFLVQLVAGCRMNYFAHDAEATEGRIAWTKERGFGLGTARRVLLLSSRAGCDVLYWFDLSTC